MSEADELYDGVLARWAVPVEPVDIPGRFGTTHVNAAGPLAGPPVVLLHGGRSTSTVWWGVVGDLVAAGHRVYAPDLIGDNGRSVHDGEPMAGIADYSRWLAETLDALAVDGAIVVGHSLGAHIAMQFTLGAPERVAKLVLLDPTDCYAPTRLRFKLRGIPLFVGRDPGRWRKFILWEAHGHRLDPQWLDLWSSRWPPAPTKSRFVLPNRLDAKALENHKTPTVVVVAGASRQNDPKALARNAAAHPTTEVVTIGAATHFTLPQEYPREVVAAIVRVEKGQA